MIIAESLKDTHRIHLWDCGCQTCEVKKWENGNESSMTAEPIAKLNNLGFDLAVIGD